MIENNGTTASVNVRSGAKVNRGNYQSEDASVGFSIEFDLAGATFDEALAELITLEQRLQHVVSAQTALALGLATTGERGEIDFGSVPAPVAAAPAAAPRAQSQGSSPQGDFAPPKVANSEKTQVIIAGIAYYDNRPFKVVAADGTAARYQPGAADFRAVDQGAAAEGQKQLWLYEKGTQNRVEETWILLAAAGVEA